MVDDDGPPIHECERCGRPNPERYGLWDYCAKCGKNLCDTCEAQGCCGSVPMESGYMADALLDDDE